MKIEEKVNITLMNLGMWPVAEVRAVKPQRMVGRARVSLCFWLLINMSKGREAGGQRPEIMVHQSWVSGFLYIMIIRIT